MITDYFSQVHLLRVCTCPAGSFWFNIICTCSQASLDAENLHGVPNDIEMGYIYIYIVNMEFSGPNGQYIMRISTNNIYNDRLMVQIEIMVSLSSPNVIANI